MMEGGRSSFLKYQLIFLWCFGAFLVQLGAIWVLRTRFVPGKVSLKMEQFKYVQEN